MNLTTNFSLYEMMRSDAAIRLDIKEQFQPSKEVIKNLTYLCRYVLEPLRHLINEPIIVTSGYRCEAVNKAIGGSTGSQHIAGMAADIKVKGMSSEQLFEFIHDSNIPYDQMIEEFHSWVHISYDGFHNRQSALRASKINGNTVYFPYNNFNG